MRINHNISAQLANVNLKKVDNRLSSNLERLSSGYKINKAADDSAGLAISNKMRTQIRSLDQASRNADDGESIIQTVDGSLGEIENILQRIRELSVQAANDTYTIDDRASAQNEIDAMLDEVDRIASTTEFNGKGLLNGSSSRTVTSNNTNVSPLDVSSNVKSGTYELKIDAVATSATATVTYTIPTTGTTKLNINDVSIEISASDSDSDVRDRIMELCDKMNIDATGGSGTLNLTPRAVGSNQSIAIKHEGDAVATVSKGTDAEVTLSTGFGASAVTTVSGGIVNIRDNAGFEMQVSIDGGAGGSTVDLTVYDAGYMTMQIGANEHQDIDLDFPTVSCQTLLLREADGDDIINVCTAGGANKSILALDDAIASISAARSELGAYANRLESTVSSLNVSSENMTDAMSRIMDTDMASAMTEYTQSNVLSQAATSMLAQANNRPQEIMSLLQA